MGHRTQKRHRLSTKSHTLPSSPTHSSSSSDFEFTIAASPRKSSADLCPADDLFYKGQLLPLHLSPRLSMVRTLLLSSSSTSSSDTTTTASRDSTSSSSSGDLLHHLDCDSSRPSSATDDELKRLTTATTTSSNMHFASRKPPKHGRSHVSVTNSSSAPASKYFSLPKFFRKEQKPAALTPTSAAVKRVSSTAKEVIRKYLKKVKPLYEKLSQKPQKPSPPPSTLPPPPSATTTLWTMKGCKTLESTNHSEDVIHTSISHSFSGNLRYPRGRSCFSSCPSSMGSSPSHGPRSGSGHGHGNSHASLSASGSTQMSRAGSGTYNSDASSMEELQNAIQGAILHCKNSMGQNKMVSNEI